MRIPLWGRTVWKYRVDSSGENQPVSVLLLDDLRSHKTKAVLDEFKTLYNTKIIILPGGLKSKITALCLKKYNEAKAAAAKDPLHKGSVPTQSLIEMRLSE